MKEFDDVLPGIKVVQENLKLLGAPLTLTACEHILSEKLDNLILSIERLKHFKSHIAYYLLKNCLAIPKLSYTLRTCPTWKFPDIISKMDSCLRHSLESIINVKLTDSKWDLCTLPTSEGGLGIRKIKDIGLPAFLASVNGTHNLVNSVLSIPDSDEIYVSYYNEAIEAWSLEHNVFPALPAIQKQWDKVNIDKVKASFNFSSKEDSARYFASKCKESSAWLNVLPSKTIGTLLDNNTFRISVALRFGCDICTPHQCVCNEVLVGSNGIHDLSCKRSAGRFSRHVELNDILKRALASAQVPSRLEPGGLSHISDKRPDGITLIQWSNGRVLSWDATCVDTLAPSYLDMSSKNYGKIAAKAATKKRWLYKEIIERENHIFIPFAIETLGPICKEGLNFINNIAQKLEDVTGESRSKEFLLQRISVALQRYNAGCVMGTFPEAKKFDEIYLL